MRRCAATVAAEPVYLPGCIPATSLPHPTPIVLKAPIPASDGKLLVLLPGMGAVATTFIAGVEAVRRGTALPIGSLSQMQTIRLGKRS